MNMLQALKAHTDKLTALVTLACVSGSVLYLMSLSTGFTIADYWWVAGLFTLFLFGFFLNTRDSAFVCNDKAKRLACLVVQYAAAIGLYFSVPYAYTAILVTMWSAQLPYFFPRRWLFILSPLWAAPLWLIHQWYWADNFAWLSALLFWGFNMFAMVTMDALRRETESKDQLQSLNRELMATQSLLSEASKQSERVRIARNIHDLLGHHLTALTINLQVAARKSEGEVQADIERCHAIAKLLLGDVREAVSEIREKSSIDFRAALKALVDNLPRINVTLQLDDTLNITDVEVADTLLRCVQESLTNTLKHGQAQHMQISLSSTDSQLRLTLKDDGKPRQQLHLGNGLRGMQERVQALGGQVKFSLESGFCTQVQLPLST